MRWTRFIAVTALAMPGDPERICAAGATRYLAKPVSGGTLLATIAEVLAGSRTGRIDECRTPPEH